jgi:hypothetical protein
VEESPFSIPSTAVSMPTRAAIPMVIIRQVITVLKVLALIDSNALLIFCKVFKSDFKINQAF